MKILSRDKQLVAVALAAGLAVGISRLALKLIELKYPDVALPVRLLIGAVPVALLVAELVVVLSYIRRQDEVQQRISIEGMALTFPVGLIVVFSLGFIMAAGVKLPLDFIDGGYIMMASMLVGYPLAYRRYK